VRELTGLHVCVWEGGCVMRDLGEVFVLTREDGFHSRPHWRHYLIARDRSLTIIEMEPTILGWRIKSVTRQGTDDWGDMTAAQIHDWKLADPSGVRLATDDERGFALEVDSGKLSGKYGLEGPVRCERS
jgi:hypothetical protein